MKITKSRCPNCGNWDTASQYQRGNKCTHCSRFYNIFQKISIDHKRPIIPRIRGKPAQMNLMWLL